MKKKLFSVALAGVLGNSALMASEEVKTAGEESSNFRHKEENVYVVAKGLVTSGDTITEEEGTKKVKGSNGRGFGIDLGYRTGYGFNFEVDYAYTKLDVTETAQGAEDEKKTGYFHSVSFDALYAYHINEPLAVFAKVGVEYEMEKISKFKTDTGFLYGAGVEYEVKENMALIFEYEDSTIEGPKGYTLAAGLVIGLDILE